METKTIFIVDDDMTNLSIGADALSGAYHVFTFSSGEKLFKRLEKQKPDLILLDVEMPEMNGYRVIKMMKQNLETRNIPVIFLTARIDGASELEGLSLGAIDYIFKPFSPMLLRKRIEMHLLIESQKLELQNFNNNLLEMVDAKTKTVVELQNAILKTISDLIDRRDDITGSHIERTQRYMEVLLKKALEHGLMLDELKSCDMNLAIQSSSLHDVGKIAIKDCILLKSGKLTDEEFDEIKKHAVFGEEVITSIQKETTESKFLEYAKIFTGTHHEKWDGSGYPRGLKGEEIPILGRIMAIVDVYDALVSDRPYKERISHEKAVAIVLECSGKHFDPVVVDLFLSVSSAFRDISALQA